MTTYLFHDETFLINNLQKTSYNYIFGFFVKKWIALCAGAAAAAQIGEVVAVQVIPRPHEDLQKLGTWLA